MICSRYIERNTPLHQLDEKFTFYAGIVAELQEMPLYINAECIRINIKPLVNAIIEHTREWHTTLGEKFALKTVQQVDSLRLNINVSICLNANQLNT